jgi:3-dehydroquinate dehydratase
MPPHGVFNVTNNASIIHLKVNSTHLELKRIEIIMCYHDFKKTSSTTSLPMELQPFINIWIHQKI